MLKRFLLTLLTLQLVFNAQAQNQAQDFIGVWEGKRSSSTNGGANEDATLTLRADGSFSESSGYLYSIYPNTQRWEYIDSSNQLSFVWVKTYYAGMAFYGFALFYVAKKTDNELVLHYDREDLSEPLPHVCAFTLENALATVDSFEAVQPRRVQSFDLLGRPVDPMVTEQMVIELYDDGSTRKVWRGR
ncbi:MAG: hypothetical protein O3C22_06110 [Bacteroidetes bacterium]|nr:hypothetical protein [Bacteroidota bacterium]MDA0943834.1 hypothetical protein [Bacteroidota bacterium]MDA1112345.1 hypothetical protein [Bacteroidota bacterium]